MYSKGVIYMLDNDSMAIYQKQCQYAVYQAGGYQRKKRILPAFGAAFSFGGYLLWAFGQVLLEEVLHQLRNVQP